jgi:molybdopterin/thiamine biosynthesis adenylyltransferase
MIARAASGMETIADLADETAGDIRIILAAPTINGPVLAGVSVPNPKGKDVMGRKTDPLRRGFRPGRVPRGLLADRFLSSSGPLTRFDVVRIDHDWIHGRGRDTRQAILKTTSVVVLGCGSIGSAVAVNLAKSGIGTLTLVDDETLTWPNTSRHSLGAASVGFNKATALAKDLQTNYPHLQIIGHDISVDGALRAPSDFLGSCSLVISLTADWGMDQALAVWRRSKGERPKLIYGWTEAHACAGHAVFTGDTSCIECGYDPTGVPQFALTEWPAEQGLQEPACGAAFQPYGGVEVASTVTLICGLVLDSILKGNGSPTHRFWAGPKPLLVASGGRWSRHWEAHPEFRDFGSLVVEQPWPPHARCASCGGCR